MINLINDKIKYLAKKNINNIKFEVELIFAQVLNCERIDLYTKKINIIGFSSGY